MFECIFCCLLFQNSTDHVTLTLCTCLCVSLSLVLESLPPARYKETISILLAWLHQCEAKLAIPSTAVTEYPIMEQRLKDVQVHICTENFSLELKVATDVGGYCISLLRCWLNKLLLNVVLFVHYCSLDYLLYYVIHKENI